MYSSSHRFKTHVEVNAPDAGTKQGTKKKSTSFKQGKRHSQCKGDGTIDGGVGRRSFLKHVCNADNSKALLESYFVFVIPQRPSATDGTDTSD
jgi:hypothetical protein